MSQYITQNITIASDHAGYDLKKYILENLNDLHFKDLGTQGKDSVNYSEFADELIKNLDSEHMGILICGSGQGMAMRANKHQHIRAALCHNIESAILARSHNDAQVLCLGAKNLPQKEALDIVTNFITTKFEGGRHEKRIHHMCSAPSLKASATPTDEVSALSARGNQELRQQDPELSKILSHELHRQEYGLEMIASENYVSPAVLAMQGSIFINKYAEGYPKKRYYGGCEYVDSMEQIAIDRVKKIFGAEHANVQPHSGAQANMAVYLALLKPGDKIMGMDLSHGGHLTHGSSVNFSGKIFKAFQYGVCEKTGRLDYDQMRDLALENRPQLIWAGFSAYPREIDFKIFREVADEIGAILCVDMAHFAGLVAGDANVSPLPFADVVTATTHKTLRGPRGGLILCKQEFAKKINSSIFPGTQGGPLEHTIAAKAVSFKEALQPEFKIYAHQIIKNAKILAEVLLENGIRLVTGGTDNHLLLLDFSSKALTGKKAEEFLDQAGITVNKNTVPKEKRSPFVTSGIRIGTAALTTRGFKEAEMKQVGQWILQVLRYAESCTETDSSGESVKNELKAIREEVKDFCKEFPLYI